VNLQAYLKLDAAGFTGALGGARSALGSLLGSVQGLMGPLAALAGAGTVAGFALKSISSAMDAENMQVAFATLMGSAKEAEATIKSLVTFAKTTPFDMPEVVSSARSLLAFGTEADKLEGTLRMVGDVAAGVQAPLKDIADIFGKARISGKLFTEDINQLTGRGIPIIQELAAQFGVSEDQVRKLAETGKIGFPQLEKAFASLTGEGGKFHGLMAALSGTSKGLFDNLKDSIEGVFREFGKPINNALKPLLEGAGGIVDTIQAKAGEAGQAVAQIFETTRNLFANGEFGQAVMLSLKVGMAEGVNYGAALLGATAEAFGVVLATEIKSAFVLFQAMGTGDFWKGVGNGLKAAFLGVFSLIGRMMAGLFDSLGDTKCLGFLKAGASRLRANADTNQEEAAGALKTSGTQLAPTFDKLLENLKGGVSKVGEVFRDGLSNVNQLVDPTDDRNSLAAILKKNIPGIAAPAADEAAKKGNATSAGAGVAETFGKATALPQGDRLAKIGLMVGGHSDAMFNHARRTADNTTRLVTGVLKIAGLMTSNLNTGAPVAVFGD
jgi:tape measure domain-containing protein